MSAKTKPAANGKPAPPLSPLDVLTLEQAAAYLQLSADTIRAELSAGRLRGRRLGDDWRFVREELIRWVRGTPAADPEALLAVVGCLAGDDTLPHIVEEAYRRREQDKVGARK